MKRTSHQLTYPFPLRPDMTITLTLPVDLTADEAEKLAVFLRTLAVPEKDKGTP